MDRNPEYDVSGGTFGSASLRADSSGVNTGSFRWRLKQNNTGWTAWQNTNHSIIGGTTANT